MTCGGGFGTFGDLLLHQNVPNHNMPFAATTTAPAADARVTRTITPMLRHAGQVIWAAYASYRRRVADTHTRDAARAVALVERAAVAARNVVNATAEGAPKSADSFGSSLLAVAAPAVASLCACFSPAGARDSLTPAPQPGTAACIDELIAVDADDLEQIFSGLLGSPSQVRALPGTGARARHPLAVRF